MTAQAGASPSLSSGIVAPSRAGFPDTNPSHVACRAALCYCRRTVNKQRAVVLAAVLVLIIGAAILLVRRPARVQAVSGTVETDEVRVASRYGGRVERIYADEGDVLKPSQQIVDLEASELHARRDYAAASLAELEHGPRPDEIAASKHEWESLTAELESARADAKRARELFQQSVISQSELDTAISRAGSLEQRAAAAKKQYDLLVEGTRPERIAQARAQLAEIEAQLHEMQIVAPTNCVLEVLSVKVGDVLPANREVATLLLTQHLWVRVYVPEPWLGRVQLGQQVNVRTDSSSEAFTGVIEQINREAEFTPRNVQTVGDRIRQVFGIKVHLPSDTGRLRAGMSVDVIFPNVPPIPK
jgi:HlyD family secretion protein